MYVYCFINIYTTHVYMMYLEIFSTISLEANSVSLWVFTFVNIKHVRKTWQFEPYCRRDGQTDRMRGCEGWIKVIMSVAEMHLKRNHLK